MAQTEIIKNPRHWRRIGWYSLAVFVLALIGLYAFAFWRYERQQAAIAEIERVGGWVLVDDGWLSWLNRVKTVGASKTANIDEGLQHLSGFTRLEGLSLENTQVSDEGLKHISSLMNLRSLSLDNTQISDEGLKHLTGLTNLGDLHLENTQVRDEGMKHLSGLTNLRSFVTTQ